MSSIPVIQIGSVVKLNAGGPRMTVLKLDLQSGGHMAATCCWFAGSTIAGWGTLQSTLFDVRILVPARPEVGEP